MAMRISIKLNGRLKNGYVLRKFPHSWFMVRTRCGLNHTSKLLEDKFISIGIPFVSIYADWKF